MSEKLVSTGGPCICCGQPEGSICSCIERLKEIEQLKAEMKKLREIIYNGHRKTFSRPDAYKYMRTKEEFYKEQGWEED